MASHAHGGLSLLVVVLLSRLRRCDPVAVFCFGDAAAGMSSKTSFTALNTRQLESPRTVSSLFFASTSFALARSVATCICA
ncbi:hypothetical protein PR003_g3330 [Phytophthora rubi]|uniref:Secreted protein n=1 Tax=Phytophthora rubi TaxID=129364 RepID=A0A6A4FQD0_9STRA|nr:hypothetical protein PR002_g10968 [Phytophthora rubi]KAE9026839.1 hypothetical protein PR001_g12111 [Phytophthora rubi]KAE9354510.1 hypothetical protein PR003_g3330 [Phytophthora rubi]